jgi:hypothetical protein
MEPSHSHKLTHITEVAYVKFLQSLRNLIGGFRFFLSKRVYILKLETLYNTGCYIKASTQGMWNSSSSQLKG